jgi:hypothetical protein
MGAQNQCSKDKAPVPATPTHSLYTIVMPLNPKTMKGYDRTLKFVEYKNGAYLLNFFKYEKNSNKNLSWS